MLTAFRRRPSKELPWASCSSLTQPEATISTGAFLKDRPNPVTFCRQLSLGTCHLTLR